MTLTLQTADERACAAELAAKEIPALHGGSVAEAKKVPATFPECFRCEKFNIRHLKQQTFSLTTAT